MLQDRYGLALSTSSEAAAYRDGIDLMLSAWPGAAEAFDAANRGGHRLRLGPCGSRARMHYIYAGGSARMQHRVEVATFHSPNPAPKGAGMDRTGENSAAPRASRQALAGPRYRAP